jgi:hypothetical protein
MAGVIVVLVVVVVLAGKGIAKRQGFGFTI